MGTNEKQQIELDLILDKGVQFHTPKVSVLKYFSKKKERTFLIKQPYLGTIDTLSVQFLSMKLDESILDKDPMGESKRLAGRSVKACAMVVAIAVLNSKWRIRLFSKCMANYFLWRVTPQKLFQLAVLINNMSNLGDFTNSIRLMSGAITTAPAVENLVESQSKLD